MSAPHDARALAIVDVDELPLPPELAPGGDADPDRPERWRDHEEDMRGPEPDDVVDTDATWNAYVRLCEGHRRDAWKPAMTQEGQER